MFRRNTLKRITAINNILFGPIKSTSTRLMTTPRTQMANHQTQATSCMPYDFNVLLSSPNLTPWKPAADQTLSSFYDDWADNGYDQDVDDDGSLGMESNHTATECAIRCIIQQLYSKNKSSFSSVSTTMLDVGCGTGLVGEMINKRLDYMGFPRLDIRGFDLSSGMLKKASDRYGVGSVTTHNAEVYPWRMGDGMGQSSLTGIDIPYGWADITLCNGVVVYLQDTNVLDEFVRVTKPGGHCIIMFRLDSEEKQPWAAKRNAIEASGQWKVVWDTPVRDNFPTYSQKGNPPSWYHVLVYQKV